jgi:hypothetical protein
MPGYANWKSLFHEEYRQLFEEGYPVGKSYQTEWPSPYLGFLATAKPADEVSEAEWQQAYHNLWAVREQGLRADFPFHEPDDLDAILAEAGSPTGLAPLDDAEYAERIRGAWFGRCAGVILGKPFEMGLDRLKIKEYLESTDSYPLDDWVLPRSAKLGMALRQDCLASTRGSVQYVEPDDDVHYTILALLLAEKKGLDFTRMDLGQSLLHNIPYEWLWSATRQAYYHLVNLSEDRPLEEQLREIPTKLNPWREGINGAIRADFWGYISPNDPRRGAGLAHRALSFNVVKNGLYGGMFTAACISAALSRTPSVETILQAGLSAIPRKSRLAAVVADVRDWYALERDWVPVCDRIYAKYGHLPFLACLHNMAFVVLALLHGNLDYTRTITTAVMCGVDTDCTGGLAGSIVGAAVGYENLDPRWILPLHDRVKTVVAGFGEGTLSDLVMRTVAVRQRTA